MKQVVIFGASLAVCMMLAFDAADKSRGGPTERCDRWESVLSNERQIKLLLVQDGCSGFSNGLRVSIDIVLSDGTRTTIFRYQDTSWNANYYNQTTPTAKWIGEHQLKISIGAVAVVEIKLEKVGTVDIEYDIGHVIHK
jgi:hypothetical protein